MSIFIWSVRLLLASFVLATDQREKEREREREREKERKKEESIEGSLNWIFRQIDGLVKEIVKWLKEESISGKESPKGPNVEWKGQSTNTNIN